MEWSVNILVVRPVFGKGNGKGAVPNGEVGDAGEGVEDVAP